MVMGAVEKEEEGAETGNGNVFPGSDNEGNGVMEDVNVWFMFLSKGVDWFGG